MTGRARGEGEGEGEGERERGREGEGGAPEDDGVEQAVRERPGEARGDHKEAPDRQVSKRRYCKNNAATRLFLSGKRAHRTALV